MDGVLAGKLAVVAGGARGIGAGIAGALAAAGARVLVADIEDETAEVTTTALREAGGQAEALRLDVTHAHDWHAVGHRVGARLDILVYAAGIFPRADIFACEPDDWQRVQAINCTGFYLGCRELLPKMAEHGGSVIAIGSVMTERANPGMLAYCVSKAGLAMLCRALARGHARQNIRVNCLNPGWVDTPGERMQRVGEPDWKDRANQSVPLGRLQTPEELGAVCCFLCSDAAASITGELLGVDGGLGI